MESGLGLGLWLGLELEFKQGFVDLEDGMGFGMEGLALVLDLTEEKRLESGEDGGGGGGVGCFCGGGGLRSLGGVAET